VPPKAVVVVAPPEVPLMLWFPDPL